MSTCSAHTLLQSQFELLSCVAGLDFKRKTLENEFQVWDKEKLAVVSFLMEMLPDAQILEVGNPDKEV